MTAGPFTWPPKPAVPASLPEPGRQRSRERAPVLPATRPGLVATVEREWLDITTEPISRRILHGEWAPDSLDLYCHRCGRSVGPHEATETGCSACRGTRPAWARMVRLGPHEGPLREMVTEVKFTRFRRLGRDLGRLLGEAVLAHATAASVPAEALARTVVVPVPTTLRRRVARGIDHTAVIAVAAAERLQAPVVRALSRRHVPSQLTVAPSRRAANVAGTMRLRRRAAGKLAGRLVVVVDDVCTTGATMRAACRALRSGMREAGNGTILWAAIVGRAEER